MNNMTRLDIRTGEEISIQIEFAKEHEKDFCPYYQSREFVTKESIIERLHKCLTGREVEFEIVALVHELEQKRNYNSKRMIL